MKRGSMTVVIVYIILVISAFITIFFISPTDEFKIYSLPLLALAAVTGTALVYWAMSSTHFKLNKKLKHMEELILHEPGELLKDLYMDIYNLYMELSENHQPKYYQKVVGIRKRLETHMQAEKKLNTLLHEAEKKEETDKKSMSELKTLYDQVYANFQKLPQKVQTKYYTPIVQHRQKLENGK